MPIRSQYKQIDWNRRTQATTRFKIVDRSTSMEVNNNTSYYRQRNNFSNLHSQPRISKAQNLNPNLSLPYKRNREQLQSNRLPIPKLQRVNYMPDEIRTFSKEGKILSQKIDFEDESF